MTRTPADYGTGGRAIRLRLAAARLVLWSECLLRTFWPAITLAAAFVALALLLPAERLPLVLHLPLLTAGAAAVAILCTRAATQLAAPRQHDAERRLERDSGLAHRPFATLRDRPASSDTAQRAAWARHRERAATSLAALRLRGPDPALAALDPAALRNGAALLLAAGLVIAGPQAGDRLEAAFLPGLSSLISGPTVSIQAWIQPPSYTGLAPIFLPPSGGEITVPAGSRLSISLTGGSLRPHLTSPDGGSKFSVIGDDSYQATALLTRSGTLRVSRFFGTMASWALTILPNDPPVAAWTEPPGIAAKSLRTRLPWHAVQRWGVATLEAVLRPAGRPDLPPLLVKIPLPGAPKDGHGAATPDLSANPYAGVAMSAHLAATDVSGQSGSSDEALFTLPARTFHHPLARAIADLRRRLALHPHAREDAAADLAALAGTPESYGGKAAIFLNITAVAALLTTDPSDAALDQAQQRLWVAALDLDGALPDASRRALSQAREDLHRALEDRARGKITDGDLARRLEALQEALDKRLQDLGRQAQAQGAIQKFDPKTDHLSSSAMDRAIRKMQEAAQAGRMDEAKQRMAELEKMLDQLDHAKIVTPEQAREQAEAAKRGRQIMGAVQDMVRRETGLLDHAQSRAPAPVPDLPQQFRSFDFPPQQGTEDPAAQDQPAPEFQPPPDAGKKQAAQEQDARVQRALQRAVDALGQALKQGGAEVPKTLGQAGQDMEAASGALSQHADRQAAEAESRAVADLQQGGRDMAKQLGKQGQGQMQLSLQKGDNQQGEEGQESGEGEGQDQHGRDPLGRQVDGHGKQGDDPDLRVPDQMEQGRSRAIQDELRRRGADRARPQQELDYIDRLLKPF